MLAAAVALTAHSSAAAQADAEPATESRVVFVSLPFGTSVEEIAAVPQLAPGVVSAGLGAVPLGQTFLDIGQGNRVNESLYDGELPPLFLKDGLVPPPVWDQVLDRADSAPANIVPGLLAAELVEAGVPVAADTDHGVVALVAVARDGALPRVDEELCARGCPPGFSLLHARVDELPRLLARLAEGDLLIAMTSGTGADQELLPVGIAGAGFDGNLSSDSTRTDGLVTTTDIAPTVLERLGLEAPAEMNGSVIDSADERDPEAVAELQAEFDDRPGRDLVALAPLAGWIALCGLAALIGRRRGAVLALRLLGLACAWAPALMLLAAALGAGEPAAALLVALGAPALAFASDRLLAGHRALALACAVTVTAYAVDVVAGSALTPRSVLGPNPGGGVRFFGIGNELEAILATLTLVGTGAYLHARERIDRRAGAVWFVVLALLAAGAFAPGRFGADVGSAIVLGVGGASAAVIALGLGRGRALLIVAGGGLLTLTALFAADALLGGAHLSRSVLGAGEAGDVLDVFDRRLTLMARTFIHPIYPELLVVTFALLIAGIVRRRRVLEWLGDGWALRSGWLGALAGILVGTLANDSGSVLLVVGTIYLTTTLGYVWSMRDEPDLPVRAASERPVP